jgi:hypothetical protein
VSAARDAQSTAPSTVRGDDIEASADPMEDAAARLAELLASFAAGPRPSLDARAVFLGMGRTAEAMRLAAGHLRQQDWLSFADEDESDMAARWSSALAALAETSGLFEEIANGWI